MLIRISGAMTKVDLSTMGYVWKLDKPEPAWGDRSVMRRERVFHIYDMYETNLAGGFVDTVLKQVVSNTYVEEVLDTVKDRFVGCVNALETYAVYLFTVTE